MITKLFKFFRITDSNNELSITNLFVYLIMYKIYKTNALSMEDISICFVAISNYVYKKKLEKGKNG